MKNRNLKLTVIALAISLQTSAKVDTILYDIAVDKLYKQLSSVRVYPNQTSRIDPTNPLEDTTNSHIAQVPFDLFLRKDHEKFDDAAVKSWFAEEIRDRKLAQLQFVPLSSDILRCPLKSTEQGHTCVVTNDEIEQLVTKVRDSSVVRDKRNESRVFSVSNILISKNKNVALLVIRERDLFVNKRTSIWLFEFIKRNNKWVMEKFKGMPGY